MTLGTPPRVFIFSGRSGCRSNATRHLVRTTTARDGLVNGVSTPAHPADHWPRYTNTLGGFTRQSLGSRSIGAGAPVEAAQGASFSCGAHPLVHEEAAPLVWYTEAAGWGVACPLLSTPAAGSGQPGAWRSVPRSPGRWPPRALGALSRIATWQLENGPARPRVRLG